METIKERLERIDAYVTIGVGGDSGSGKTTFSSGIRRLMGKDMVSGFSMDDYHTEDRETRRKTGHLPLDPRYNHLDLLAQHLVEIRKGNEIIKPVYNHKTGTLDPQVLYAPNRINIIEGLHPFYTEGLRKGMDLKIFVDPVREVKWKWKLERDVNRRGHDRDAAFREMLAREKLFKLYIDVQKVYSDIVLRVKPSRYSDDGIDNPRVSLIMVDPGKHAGEMDINLDLGSLLGGSRKYFSLEFGKDYHYGKMARIMTVDGLMSRESLHSVQERICSFTGTECDNLLGETEEYANPSAVAQIIIAWRFLERLDLILSDLESAGE